ncbi:hypothetical protein F0562_033266 [Nyssa sinensis]|uniref:Uncharacterized protein n=1 Tax=Nyssa sinensis TaxID=561372 RepID=A0A5J5AW10_9ASTE|nr:hypothetical protein F0562_033266 [Nyssa sinensis]
MVTVLGHCRVAPPPGTVAEQSLPLIFFDLPLLNFPPVQHLLFYKSPQPKTYFLETLVPNLKDSLSLVLKHFFPLAGNLIINSNSIRPEICYMDGDSVSLTFAESSNDFNYLTGNYARNAEEFYPFVPQMPQVTRVSDTVVAPLLALQVTLFPNFGTCLGITFHHVAADANSFIRFLKSWASIAKLGGDEGFLVDGSLPFYARTVREDPNGLETSLWSKVREIKLEEGQLQYPLKNKVRATFVMSQTHVQWLKKMVSTQRPKLLHVSTFTVTCAYVWVCMVKSRAAGADELTDGDELEYFLCVADCRARFEPPIPETYFGNCLTDCFVTTKNIQLVGEEGFLTAAELIGEAIRKRAKNEAEVLKDMEAFFMRLRETKWERVVAVSGTPKLSFYGLDFGWGRPIKSEIISIDSTGAFSLGECRDSELEIGITYYHVAADANTLIRFLKLWASIAKLGGGRLPMVGPSRFMAGL